MIGALQSRILAFFACVGGFDAPISGGSERRARDGDPDDERVEPISPGGACGVACDVDYALCWVTFLDLQARAP